MFRPAGSPVVLMGSCLGLLLTLWHASPLVAQSGPTMDAFMGMNVHTYPFQDGLDDGLYADVVSRLRNYHGFNWDVGNDANNPTTLPMAANGVNWQTLYGGWVDDGFKINAAVQFGGVNEASWDEAGQPNAAEQSAYQYGQSFAQVFGSGTNGLDIVDSVQIGNEPGHYSDDFYRTVFDNMAQGVRDGDPNMTIVSANVHVGASTAYSKSVAAVFNNPDTLSRVDVLATHTYPLLRHWPSYEQSFPEDTNMDYISSVQALIDWRDQNAPGKKVWVTEFGYGAHDPDTAFTPPSDSRADEWLDVTDLQQAQYLTRSYLLFAEMGVDRAYMYWFDDDNTPWIHGSSGLTRNYVPKPSYYAVAQMNSLLGAFAFDGVEHEDADYYAYRFAQQGEADQQVWVFWSPTGDGSQTVVTLDLPGELLWAQAMATADGDAPLVPITTLSDGRLQFTVGESPIYLRLSNVPEPAAGLLLMVIPLARGRLGSPWRNA